MSTTTNAISKVAAVAVGLAMVTSVFALAPIAQAALSASQVSAILSLLTSFGADASTIANVNASLTGSTPSAPSTPAASSSCSFTRDLMSGSTGADVTCLQNALKAGGYMSANATGYFGALTQAGVVAWQKAAGVSPAAGYFGAKSRAAFGGSSTNPSAPVVSGNGLKVMLATDSPNNIALVQGQATGELAKFTFANPTSADVKVTNATFKRIGVSTDSSLSNVYLFDGVVRITDPAGISNSTFNFNDSTGIFTVPAGGTKMISVRADIAGSTSGQQIGVQLVSIGSSATLDSSVAFPISGYTQTVSSASIATVVFGTVTTPASNSSLPPGTDTTVFQSTVTVGTRAVLLKSITLENRGSTVDADFQNLRLYVKGVQVGSTVAATTAKKVVFDFSASPLRLETGGNDFRVAADIVGGSGDTVDFQVRRAVDGQFIDADLNQPILPTGDFSGTADTVEGVDLSVTKASNSPSSAVAVDATNVKWASFEFRAIGDDLKVEQITVDVDDNDSAAVNIDNGKVFLNGVQIGSTQDIVEGGTTAFSFGSQMILKKGTVAIVDIYADAKQADGTSIASGSDFDFGVSVATADTEGVKSGNRLSSAISEVEGNSVVVSSASLSASKDSSHSNQSVVAGTNGFKLGVFTLAAGANEGVNINTIDIDFVSTPASTLTNLRLTNASTGATIGSTKSSVSTSNTFSVTGISIPASNSIKVNVYADVKSSANIGAISATTVTTSTGGTGITTGNSVSVGTAATLQTMTVVSSGTLTTAVNTGGTPADAIVVGGTNAVKIGSFNFLATNASQTVNKVLVKVPSNSASAVGTITLKDASTGAAIKSQGFDLGAPGTAPYATSTFTNLGFAVPAGTSKALDVYVDVVSIDSNNAALSGEALSVVLDGNEGFEATDSAGNLTTALTGSADLSSDGTNVGVLYVRKSSATFTPVVVSDVLAAGTDQVIGKFTITANNSGDNGVDWGKIAFTVTKTAGVTLGATTTIALYDITAGANTLIAGTYATTTGNHVAQSQMFTSTATSGLIDFRPTTIQNVPKGSSRTYELRTTIGSLATGNNNVSISITNPSTSVTTSIFSTVSGTIGTALSTSVPSIAWSDWSDVSDHFSSASGGSTSDWTNDFLVKTLPFTIGTRSVSVSS